MEKESVSSYPDVSIYKSVTHFLCCWKYCFLIQIFDYWDCVSFMKSIKSQRAANATVLASSLDSTVTNETWKMYFHLASLPRWNLKYLAGWKKVSKTRVLNNHKMFGGKPWWKWTDIFILCQVHFEMKLKCFKDLSSLFSPFPFPPHKSRNIAAITWPTQKMLHGYRSGFTKVQLSTKTNTAPHVLNLQVTPSCCQTRNLSHVMHKKVEPATITELCVLVNKCSLLGPLPRCCSQARH